MRIYEVWIGRQASGKTVALQRRVAALASRAGIRSIWILDRMDEWPSPQTRPYFHHEDQIIVRDMGEYYARTREALPGLVVFRFGREGGAYDQVFTEAIAEGDVCLVLDEAYEYMPSGSSWRGPAALRDIVLAGRHLTNIQGQVRPVHLVIATQYPRTIHPRAWGQAETVLVSSVEGESTRKWIKDNFGEHHLDAVERLGQYQWHPVRGNMPQLAPYRGGR